MDGLQYFRFGIANERTLPDARAPGGGDGSCDDDDDGVGKPYQADYLWQRKPSTSSHICIIIVPATATAQAGKLAGMEAGNQPGIRSN